MKTTKIIFFGTSDRSIPILNALKENFQLVLCVTKKDSKIGRKQITKETEVKKWCIENKIDFLELDSLKDVNLEYVLEKIKNIKPEYGLVADFSYIIPKKIIDSIPGGIINIHFSLLPKYRGASPVQFAILNGNEITGVTYYLLDEGMDTGDVIFQLEYKIESNFTSEELYDILFKISAEKLPDVLNKFIKKELIPYPQYHESATYTISKNYPKKTVIFKEDALINWGDDPKKIERMVRAFNPWPIAWTNLEDIENINCFIEKIQLKDHVDKSLKVKIFKLHLASDKLQIDELQVEGKRRISWDEFKNGYLK